MEVVALASTMTVGTVSVQTPQDSTIWPRWNGLPVVYSAFTNAPIIHDVVIHEPNGAAVSETTVATHRYQHQPKVWYDSRNGWFHIVFVSGGVSEDTGGQQIVYARSEDGGATWTTPVILIASQSTFDTVGANSYGPVGDIAMFTWSWIEDAGQLFFVGAAQELTLTVLTDMPGLALLAREVLADGTFGTTYCISTNAYSARDGKSTPAFDQALHDRIYHKVRVFGWCGGNSPGAPVTDWVGFFESPSVGLVSETVWADLGSDQNRLVLGRSFSDSDVRQVARTTTDGGTNFTGFRRTDIPSGDMRTQTWKSPVSIERLSDGTFLMAGNFATNRLHAWLARADQFGRVENVQMAWTNVLVAPVSAGVSKGGVASYVSIATDGTNVVYAVSFTKEKILARAFKIVPRR